MLAPLKVLQDLGGMCGRTTADSCCKTGRGQTWHAIQPELVRVDWIGHPACSARANSVPSATHISRGEASHDTSSSCVQFGPFYRAKTESNTEHLIKGKWVMAMHASQASAICDLFSRSGNRVDILICMSPTAARHMHQYVTSCILLGFHLILWLLLVRSYA